MVEAKAYIEEGVDYASAAGETSGLRINKALADAKAAFSASGGAFWERPFYQYANRLAHLYFARRLNGLDAYLLFIYFADATDVPEPSSESEWRGAIRVVEKSLGLKRNHPFRRAVGALIWSVSDMLSRRPAS